MEEISTPKPSDLTDWKKVDKTNYSFLIPTEWRVDGRSIYSYAEEDITNPGVPVPPNELKVEIYDHPGIEYDDVESWLNEIDFEDNLLGIIDLNVNDNQINIVRIRGQLVHQILSVYILDPDKKTAVRITAWPYDTQHFATFKKIVQSFQFN